MSESLECYECVEYTYDAQRERAHVVLRRAIVTITPHAASTTLLDERHSIDVDLRSNIVTCKALDPSHAPNAAHVARDFKEVWDDILGQVGDPAELDAEALYVSI